MVALQVMGSPTLEFFYELSLLYASSVVQPVGFELLFLIVYPSGKWSLSDSPEPQPEPQDLSVVLQSLPQIDLVVPHLFCPAGLTAYRSLFGDVLGYPMVGSGSEVLTVAQNKHLTRLIANDRGVRVAPGLLIDLRSNTRAEKNWSALGFPLIVKPNQSDNSDGLTLVRNPTEMEAALRLAGQYDDEVIVEKYIPGREIRGAVIELDGTLRVLPFIEYLVNDEHPIRLAEDKLRTDEDGHVAGQSAKENVPAVCPAAVDDALTEQLGTMMLTMHRALGCRDYSLYDFRVDQSTGVPYLLEAGLFWSFGEKSMISTMLEAADLELREVTRRMWLAAVNRG
ncbi:ATP-grasp domain-containing protein [Lewinella sp. 4G2]|uniref:D-alanine--D-alanine ligase family protein n=1 Tax=Lewinella sp. 4G2 TaxID=1803372 RepID=UPI0012F7BBFC|nr:ATP-grasp domain-containing protein [Lewinella sp. 4G2]